MKVIFAGYFGEWSIFGDKTPELDKYWKGGRKNFSCRYIEIHYLWYLYIREFLPKDYHIFFVDSGSPIPIDWLLEKINEPYEFLDKKEYKLDFSKKIHVRRFYKTEVHREGWLRTFQELQKVAYYNNVDLFHFQSDALFAYDYSKDIKDKEFVCTEFHHTLEQDIIFISKEVLHRNYLGHKDFIGFLDWVRTRNIQDQYFYCAEGGLKEVANTIKEDKKSEFSNLNLFIHDVSVKTFLKFVSDNPIKNEFLNVYVENLKRLHEK